MGWSPHGLKILFRKGRRREGRREREMERGGEDSGLNPELLEGPKLNCESQNEGSFVSFPPGERMGANSAREFLSAWVSGKWKSASS